MVQHLQDILGKLYRPAADGTRQVFALSRSDAEPLLLLIAEKAQPEKEVSTLAALLRVVRLSLALPSRFAGMRLHSAVTQVTTVWSRPRPAGICSAPLPSPARRMSQNIPPESGIPCALVVSTSSTQAAMATSPKPVDWTGRLRLSGGIARGG